MKANYLNLAIQRKCPKRDECYPKNKPHDCVQCNADMEAQKSESDYLDMMAESERSATTEW